MFSRLKEMLFGKEEETQELEYEVRYFKEHFPELTEEEIRETIHVIEAIYGDEDPDDAINI